MMESSRRKWKKGFFLSAFPFARQRHHLDWKRRRRVLTYVCVCVCRLHELDRRLRVCGKGSSSNSSSRATKKKVDGKCMPYLAKKREERRERKKERKKERRISIHRHSDSINCRQLQNWTNQHIVIELNSFGKSPRVYGGIKYHSPREGRVLVRTYVLVPLFLGQGPRI